MWKGEYGRVNCHIHATNKTKFGQRQAADSGGLTVRIIERERQDVASKSRVVLLSSGLLATRLATSLSSAAPGLPDVS